MDIIDTHAHLDDERFDGERAGVLQRAAEAGVGSVLCVGTTVESSRRAVELAREFPGQVYAAVGVHPNRAAEAGQEAMGTISQLAMGPEVVAIGETGLDYYHDYTPPDEQKRWFRAHIELSRRLRKPVIVHSRKSEEDAIEVLEEFPAPLQGIRHCYSGAPQLLERQVELGLHISFACNIAREGHKKMKAAARAVPDDRLLVETDCPYLAPPQVESRRNEPAFVVHAVRALAEIRGSNAETIATLTADNARALLGID